MMSESDRVRPNRVPIWYVEHELDGMPSEWVYCHSSCGEPVGYIVLPEGMHVGRYVDSLRFCADPPKPGACSVVIASLCTRRAVEAALDGEFGLSWEAYPGAISPEGRAAGAGERGFRP